VRLLVLGGTAFLGRFVVEVALARGDEITLFNRGQTNPQLFPQVQKRVGDRNGDLSALKGGQWDAVIDTSGFTSKQLRASAGLLPDSVAHYTFVSSISAYSDYSRSLITEDSPVHPPPSPESDQVTAENYGAQKVASEQTAERLMPGRVACVRAGLIVGPFDTSGRFPYWVRRIAQGGTVLAPGRPERHVQVIDVRDLAAWLVHLAATRTPGVYNAAGPESRLTMSQVLETCQAVSGSDASFVWVDDEFLESEGVGPWEEMPLWLPASANSDGIFAASNERAMAAGLHFRPLAETAQATLAWIRQSGEASQTAQKPGLVGKAGLSAEREAALIQKWQNREVTP
jgi:2'-hydroxyisoflavone reductase